MDTKTTLGETTKQDKISFQPTARNRQLLDQCLGVKRTNNGKPIGAWKPQRGKQTEFINKAMEKYLPTILAEEQAKLSKLRAQP